MISLNCIMQLYLTEDIQTIYDEEKLKVTHSLQDNLALNKPTSQSSVSNGGVSSRAVDGIVDGIYTNNSITHTVQRRF